MSAMTAAPDQHEDTDRQARSETPAATPTLNGAPRKKIAPRVRTETGEEATRTWQRIKKLVGPVAACAFVVIWWNLASSGGTPPQPDFLVRSITFHQQAASGQHVLANSQVFCHNGSQPFQVMVQVHKYRGSGAYYGPKENRPQVHLAGRPVDGQPDEVVETSAPLTMTSSFSDDKTLVLTPQVPPSFAGRDIVWTATAWHPSDPNHVNDTFKTRLPVCG